jgi:hypothetical protein
MIEQEEQERSEPRLYHKVQDNIYCNFADVALQLLKREGKKRRLRFLSGLRVYTPIDAARLRKD